MKLQEWPSACRNSTDASASCVATTSPKTNWIWIYSVSFSLLHRLWGVTSHTKKKKKCKQSLDSSPFSNLFCLYFLSLSLFGSLLLMKDQAVAVIRGYWNCSGDRGGCPVNGKRRNGLLQLKREVVGLWVLLLKKGCYWLVEGDDKECCLDIAVCGLLVRTALLLLVAKTGLEKCNGRLLWGGAEAGLCLCC